jgi:hypothetical protein
MKPAGDGALTHDHEKRACALSPPAGSTEDRTIPVRLAAPKGQKEGGGHPGMRPPPNGRRHRGGAKINDYVRALAGRYGVCHNHWLLTNVRRDQDDGSAAAG